MLEAIFSLLRCKDLKFKLPPEIAVEELWCAPIRFSGDILYLVRQVTP